MAIKKSYASYMGLAAAILAAGLWAAPVKAASGSDAAKDAAKVLSELHLSNVSEIEMGKLALQKATTQGAKDLGQRLVTDHSQNDQELQQLAQQQGISLMEPAQSNELKSKQKDAQGMMKDLEKATGADFDHRFAKIAAEDHQKDVKKMTSNEKKLPDGAVRDFVSRTIPVLNSHLQMAQSLKKQS